jgi:ABC-2 type transport system permease protein
MKKPWLVARREYFYNLRRRSFLFAVFGVPIFTFAAWFVVFAVISSSEENIEGVGQVGYVDHAGILDNALFPREYPDLFVAYPDETNARQALDNQSIGAYVTLPADYLKTGSVYFYSYGGIPEALKSAVTTFLLTNLSRQLDDEVLLERIQEPIELTVRVQDSGRNLTRDNLPALIFMPMIFAFVFFMAAGATSGFLMNGIVEERTNRIMEILLTSVTPLQILLGKIIGLGLLGLTQLVVWGAAGFLLIRFGQALPLLSGLAFPTDMALVFLAYFLLSYFLLASLMAGLGAVAGSEQESRQYSSIISLLFIAPFFAIVPLINEPDGNLATVLTMVPFTAPVTVLLRMGFGTIPAWQLGLSLLILLLVTVFVIWAAAKVFRWGLLLYGKRISLRELWRVVRSSPSVEVGVAHAAQEGV